MKRIYKVNAINENNEILYTNEAKNKKQVKNIVNAFNHTVKYTVTKNNKLIKKMCTKSALEIINNNTFNF